MGQQQTRGNQSILDINHFKFNKVTLLNNKNEKQPDFMEVEFPCDQSSYKLWKEQLQILKAHTPSQSNLLLPQKHKFSQAGLCSKSGILKVTYQKFPYLLEDQILKVQNKKSTFSEPQIWKILLALVSAKKQYQSISNNSSDKLGNINPKNIFLNDKSEIKIANPLSWPNYIDGYKSAVLKQVSYLSTEDLKLLQLGSIQNDQNKNSEIFSIGMSLLSVGLPQNLQHLYDLEKHIINPELFEEKLLFWKTSLYYSEILRSLVLNFLHKNASKRLALKQIDEFLGPHKQNINNLKPLTINTGNDKIHAEVDKLRNQLPINIKTRFYKYPAKPQLKGKLNASNQPSILNNVVNYAQPNSLINRNKSPARFTYSNPVSGIVSPSKIIPAQKSKIQIILPNGPVSNQKNTVLKNSQQKKHSPKPHHSQRPVDIVDEIYPPHDHDKKKLEQKSNEIAQRLIQQGQGKIIHADSEIEASQPYRLSSQTQINRLHAAMVNPQIKASFQKSDIFDYHTYADIVITADFQSTWKEYIKMIEKPDLYFNQLQDKLIVANGTIQIPPGRVRLQTNKQEGKIHLENISTTCKGDILGGVSKNANNQTQVWFNSSYTHDGKPFPKKQFLTKSLQKLKAHLQSAQS